MTAPSRPSLAHARRVHAIVALTAAVGAIIVAVLALTGGLRFGETSQSRGDVPSGPAPWDYTLPAWDEALGGDEGLTSANYDVLGAYVDEDLDGESAALRALGEQTSRADLTGQGQAVLAARTPAGIAPYWPAPGPVAPPPQCTDLTFLATSPAALPVSGPDVATLGVFDRYAKILLTYTGTCADGTYDASAPGVDYVYAGHSADTGWVALRYWQVPSEEGHDTLPGATEPYDWELKAIAPTCAPSTLVRARITVADAFDLMCAQAEQDGITLKATSGYRTRSEQALMFADAIAAYGSEAAARQRVAYADKDVCTSRHCSGMAINVAEDAATAAWLTQTVGCVAADGTVSAATSCVAGTTAVPNAARWGFSAPLAVSPGYLEFTLPIAADGNSSLGTPNCYPRGVAVANQVASIFRCRLARDGVVGPAQEKVVAEALTVARCESGWNATAAAYGGRFATTPHPATGRTYTHRGVFMLTAEQAAAGWVTGGVDAVDDPIANINAAASLWVTTHSWEQFGCATGADPQGFEAGPVLPQYGGPELPQWAHLY